MLYTIRNIIENGSTCTIEFKDYKPITMDTEWVENNELKPDILMTDSDFIKPKSTTKKFQLVELKESKYPPRH